MLLRKEEAGLVVIPQPSHAWVAGQMARAWGNDMFDRPMPYEEVCLAVEQHDIAWLDRDQRPEFDPATGAPREFWHVPASTHTALWSEGVRRARVFGRYPALLVSLHGLTIYDLTFDPTMASPENAAAVERFRTEQQAVQSALLGSLRAELGGATETAIALVERNRSLLLALDTMALHACWGLSEPVTIKNVPAAGAGRCDLILRPFSGKPGDMMVEPWPFGPATIALKAEGRRLSGSYADDQALQAAWDVVEGTGIDVRLHPTDR